MDHSSSLDRYAHMEWAGSTVWKAVLKEPRLAELRDIEEHHRLRRLDLEGSSGTGMVEIDPSRLDLTRRPSVEFRHRIRADGRGLLWSELLEARNARRRSSGRIGTAVLAAVVLMMVFGDLYLAAGAIVIGIGSEIIRQVRLANTIRRLWRELRDPMDGS